MTESEWTSSTSGPSRVSAGSEDIGSVCGRREALGGGVHITSLAAVSMTRCIIQNNSARCGGGVAVSGSASVAVSNCSFFDNLAFGRLNGTAMGGGLYVRDDRPVLAVKPLWATGAWANAPLVREMYVETAGPIQDMLRVVRRQAETGVRATVVDAKFWNNAALSTGGAQRTFGGGVLASNGAFDVSSSHFWYNTATDGDSLAAVGESNQTACNGNDPPVALVDDIDCTSTVRPGHTTLPCQPLDPVSATPRCCGVSPLMPGPSPLPSALRSDIADGTCFP